MPEVRFLSMLYIGKKEKPNHVIWIYVLSSTATIAYICGPNLVILGKTYLSDNGCNCVIVHIYVQIRQCHCSSIEAINIINVSVIIFEYLKAFISVRV